MPKIKAAFAGENEGTIQYVFGERISVVTGLTDLNPLTLNKANVSGGAFRETEVLFGTWGMPQLTEEELKEYLPNLKVLFYAAGDTRAFHAPYFKLGIPVSSAWRSNAVPVAEYAFAQIVLALKNYFALTRRIRETKQWYGHPVGPGAYGATVALIGSGTISQKIQKMLAQMDVKVLVVSSYEDRRTVSLEEAFRTAQVVSNHLPDLGVQNAKVLTGAMFESMPPNAVFINTGRGQQVNEPEMIAALKKRPDITALLDVTWPEPPVAGSELYTLPNVQLSPHVAGSMNDEVRRMADCAIEEFKRYRDGETLQQLIEQ